MKALVRKGFLAEVRFELYQAGLVRGIPKTRVDLDNGNQKKKGWPCSRRLIGLPVEEDIYQEAVGDEAEKED